MEITYEIHSSDEKYECSFDSHFYFPRCFFTNQTVTQSNRYERLLYYFNESNNKIDRPILLFIWKL